MQHFLIGSKESCLMDQSISPKYIIVNFNYNTVRVEEILYEISSPSTQEEILHVMVAIIKDNTDAKRSVSIVKETFELFKSIHSPDLFTDEYEELVAIFSRFILNVKLSLSANNLADKINKFSFMVDDNWSSLLILDKDCYEHVKNRKYAPICDFGDRPYIS